MAERRMRGERLQIMLTPSELLLVDDFRFKKRMPSRAAAVRELLQRGLSAEGFEVASPGAQSKDFGVGANKRFYRALPPADRKVRFANSHLLRPMPMIAGSHPHRARAITAHGPDKRGAVCVSLSRP